jgi:hypothetical protein
MPSNEGGGVTDQIEELQAEADRLRAKLAESQAIRSWLLDDKIALADSRDRLRAALREIGDMAGGSGWDWRSAKARIKVIVRAATDPKEREPSDS